MNWKVLADVFKKIPWEDMKKYGPVIAAKGKEIYDEFKQKKGGLSIEQRLEIIEKTEKDQQSYIAQLEEMITKNSDYIHRLSMRINILFIIVIGTLVYLILS